MLRDFSGLLFEYIFYVGGTASCLRQWESQHYCNSKKYPHFTNIYNMYNSLIQGPNNLNEIKEISPQVPHLCTPWQDRSKRKFKFARQFKRKNAIATELQLLLLLPQIPTLSKKFVRAHFIIINWHMLGWGRFRNYFFSTTIDSFLHSIIFSYLFLI